MKVLAINGSPNMDRGNTALILNPFLDGMREAGAVVEVLYTRRLTVNPCLGEFNCWLKTPGQCFQQDDMAWLLPKIAEADIRVLATPLYVDGLTGPLKNLLDRTIPLSEPLIEMRRGHCRHPGRLGTKSGRLVLVASCGFWEMDNFNPLLAHIKAVCKNAGMQYAGALLRPHGPALKPMMEMGLPVADIFRAAHKAGRQLIAEGKIAAGLLKTIGRELLPRDMYVEQANDFFRKALKNR